MIFSILSKSLISNIFDLKIKQYLGSDLPSYMKVLKIHSLIFKCTEMCSLFENTLLNLLNVPLNYSNKHSLPISLYDNNDVGGVISSFHSFNNAQRCRTQCVKMCSLKKSFGEP